MKKINTLLVLVVITTLHSVAQESQYFSMYFQEGFGFETKVVRKLEEFPNWNPAVYKGRPVKSAFVLPIADKLMN